MDEISLDEMKEIEISILDCFHDICERNNLKYSLAYGTLLGAVRHQGFIPWDDDVDVMMPRPDYESFIKIADRELINTKYRFLCLENEKSYYSPLAKIYDNRTKLRQHDGHITKTEMGVYIDIFVVDGIPEDVNLRRALFEEERKLRLKWLLSCRSFLSPLNTSKNIWNYFLKSIYSVPFRLIGTHHYLKQYNSLACRYAIDESKYCGVILFGEGEKKELLPREYIYSLKKIKFENNYYWAIENADLYLSNIYGDYMQLPPESERVSKHPHTVTWRQINKK